VSIDILSEFIVVVEASF